jgi:hypothetical protein
MCPRNELLFKPEQKLIERDMSRNWIRKLVGGLSLTSALFVFQACYGTPQDYGLDLLIEGQVKSKTSGLPIKGIKVSVADNMQFEITDEEGGFLIFTQKRRDLTIKFQDVDASENGLYADKDTILNEGSERVYLNILMEAK